MIANKINANSIVLDKYTSIGVLAWFGENFVLSVFEAAPRTL